MARIKQLHIVLLSILFFSSSFAANRWAGLGVNGANSARSLEQGQISAGIHSRFSFDGSILEDKLITRNNQTETLDNLAIANQYLGVSFGIINYFDVGVSVPVFFLDTPGSIFAGDVSYQLKYTFTEQIKLPDMIRVALILGGNIPVSSDKGSIPRAIENIPQVIEGTGPTAGEFAGDYKASSTNNFGFYSNLAISMDFTKVLKTPTELLMNVGAKSPELWTDDNYFHIINGSVGTMIQIHPALSFYSGYHREQRLEKKFSSQSEVSELQFVLEALSPVGIGVHGGVNWGIFNDEFIPISYKNDSYKFAIKGSPDLAFTFGLTWSGFLKSKDIDGDGFLAEADKCPEEPEDKDGFEDKDGCPDLDNDQDKIVDADDKCPNKSEDMDKFEDDDGCPDLDNDQDKIVDIQDKCPMEAEDYDNFEDKDGCPDLDNDKDAIADAEDKCPNKAEDIDNFEDKDGCPDLDNDKDNIADAIDKCPLKAEVVNGFLDKDGCPDVKPKKDFAELAREVLFALGTSELKIKSKAKLDSVAKLLHEYPKVKIKVEGHTDNISTLELNAKLSDARAKSVLDYLITKGIKKDRMVSKGFGPTKPIADNKTPVGRAKNRRVELIPIQ